MSSKDNIVVIFDLDDTLYKEQDYVISAFRYISQQLSLKIKNNEEVIYLQMMSNFRSGKEVFSNLIKYYELDLKVSELITTYRNHKPNITLDKKTLSTLKKIKSKAHKVGVITDGRSVQQRNKIKALGLENFFDDIIISEEFGSKKPALRNFKYFQSKYGPAKFWYIGDNTTKDFKAPVKLGWKTICLIGNEKNIHRQKFNLPKEVKPNHFAKNIESLIEIILLQEY